MIHHIRWDHFPPELPPKSPHGLATDVVSLCRSSKGQKHTQGRERVAAWRTRLPASSRRVGDQPPGRGPQAEANPVRILVSPPPKPGRTLKSFVFHENICAGTCSPRTPRKPSAQREEQKARLPGSPSAPRLSAGTGAPPAADHGAAEAPGHGAGLCAGVSSPRSQSIRDAWSCAEVTTKRHAHALGTPPAKQEM